MTTRKITITVVAVMALAVAISASWYFKVRLKPQERLNSTVDYYTRVHAGAYGKNLDEAKKLFADKKISEGVALLNGIKDKLTNPGERSIVELAIADAVMKDVDVQKGSELFAQIAHDNVLPSLTRAYAMLVVVDQFTGFQDKEVLKPFFSKEEFDSSTGNQLASKMRKEIFHLYPYGYAAGNIAFEQLFANMSPNFNAMSDKDYADAMMYMTALDEDLNSLNTSDGMKTFIPVTLQAKAKVYRLIEAAGRPLPATVESVYDAAIARSRVLGIPSAESFSMLGLADYLAQKKDDPQKVVAILKQLNTTQLEKMVKARLSSKAQFDTSYPFLRSLIGKNTDVEKAYKSLLDSNRIEEK